MSQPKIINSLAAMNMKRPVHQFQVADTFSCTSATQKVQNLRNQIRELENRMHDINRYDSKMEFLSAGLLVATVIQETSIGFLDVAAAILSTVPAFKGAAEVAEKGATSVKAAKDFSEFQTGQITKVQLTLRTTQHAATFAPKATMGQKVAMFHAKASMDAVALAIGDKQGGAYVHDTLSNTLGMVKDSAEGLSEAAKATKILNGIAAFDSVYKAMNSYDAALQKAGDVRIDEKIQRANYVRTQRQNTKHLMGLVRDRLNVAQTALNDCVVANYSRPTTAQQ